MKDIYYKGKSGEKVLELGFCACTHISPENDLVVTASAGTLLFWNLKSGEIIDRLAVDYEHAFYTVFSDDDKMMVIYLEKGENFYLWDIAERRQIREFQGHEDWIFGIEFCNQNMNLVSFSADKTLKLWDIESGKEIRTFTGHEHSVSSVDFIEERDLLISCSYDKTIRFWNIKTGELLKILEGHESADDNVIVSPDEKTVVSSSFDGTARIWDIDTGRELLCLRPNIGHINYCQFLDNGRILETHSSCYLVKFWDTENYEEIRIPGFDSNLVSWVAEDKDGRLLGVLPRDYRVILSTSKDEIPLKDLIKTEHYDLELHSRGEKPYPMDIHIITDRESKEFITVKEPGLLKHTDRNKNLILPDYYPEPGFRGADSVFFELATGKEIFSTNVYTGFSNCVAFSPDGKMLATGHGGHKLHLKNAGTGEIIRTINEHYDYICTKIAFTTDGKYIINRTGSKEVCMWEVESGRKVRGFPIYGDVEIQGNWIVGVDKYSDEICIWDIFTGKKIRTLGYGDYNRKEACLSPDRKTLVILGCKTDKTNFIFKDLETGEETFLQRGLVGECSSLEAFSFSPDSSLYAFGNPDEDLLLVRNLREKRSIYLSTDENAIYCVVFSPDGKNIAYGGNDRFITVRNLENKEIVKEFEGHTGIVETLAFSPDGKTLASSSWDGTVRLWEV